MLILAGSIFFWVLWSSSSYKMTCFSPKMFHFYQNRPARKFNENLTKFHKNAQNGIRSCCGLCRKAKFRWRLSRMSPLTSRWCRWLGYSAPVFTTPHLCSVQAHYALPRRILVWMEQIPPFFLLYIHQYKLNESLPWRARCFFQKDIYFNILTEDKLMELSTGLLGLLGLAIVCLTLVSLTAISADNRETPIKAIEALKTIFGTKLSKSK